VKEKEEECATTQTDMKKCAKKEERAFETTRSHRGHGVGFGGVSLKKEGKREIKRGKKSRERLRDVDKVPCEKGGGAQGWTPKVVCFKRPPGKGKRKEGVGNAGEKKRFEWHEEKGAGRPGERKECMTRRFSVAQKKYKAKKSRLNQVIQEGAL